MVDTLNSRRQESARNGTNTTLLYPYPCTYIPLRPPLRLWLTPNAPHAQPKCNLDWDNPAWHIPPLHIITPNAPHAQPKCNLDCTPNCALKPTPTVLPNPPQQYSQQYCQAYSVLPTITVLAGPNPSCKCNPADIIKL